VTDSTGVGSTRLDPGGRRGRLSTTTDGPISISPMITAGAAVPEPRGQALRIGPCRPLRTIPRAGWRWRWATCTTAAATTSSSPTSRKRGFPVPGNKPAHQLPEGARSLQRDRHRRRGRRGVGVGRAVRRRERRRAARPGRVNGFISADSGRDYWYAMSKIAGAQGNIFEDAKNWPPIGTASLSGYERSRVLLNRGTAGFRGRARRRGHGPAGRAIGGDGRSLQPRHAGCP